MSTLHVAQLKNSQILLNLVTWEITYFWIYVFVLSSKWRCRIPSDYHSGPKPDEGGSLTAEEHHHWVGEKSEKEVTWILDQSTNKFDQNMWCAYKTQSITYG